VTPAVAVSISDKVLGFKDILAGLMPNKRRRNLVLTSLGLEFKADALPNIANA
jgi:hypothetical protein